MLGGNYPITKSQNNKMNNNLIVPNSNIDTINTLTLFDQILGSINLFGIIFYDILISNTK